MPAITTITGQVEAIAYKFDHNHRPWVSLLVPQRHDDIRVDIRPDLYELNPFFERGARYHFRYVNGVVTDATRE